MAVFGGDEESAVMQAEVKEPLPADQRAHGAASVRAVQRERIGIVIGRQESANFSTRNGDETVIGQGAD
jgi:hypothetical protein